MTIQFCDPKSQETLNRDGDLLLRPDGSVAAPIIGGIPRFVDHKKNYAENFGTQWKNWTSTLNDERGGGSHKYDLLVERTKFNKYVTNGKSILECGCGGGDDTEALLRMGFSEVHSFDLSTAVERAAATIDDDRLTLSQASIFDIPYADESFDFVFCHRVLQHTPDPAAALRSICRKVRPGGVLFAHSYKLSLLHLCCFKYKIRWYTKHLPHESVMRYVMAWGPRLRKLNHFLHRFGAPGRFISYSFVPFYYYSECKQPGFSEDRLLQLDQLNTFDALTPRYDKPMSSRKFKSILKEEGFELDYFWESIITPLYGTARKEV